MTPTPPDDSLKLSARALRYAAAIAVVVVGILCGAIIPGTLGGTICTSSNAAGRSFSTYGLVALRRF